MSRRLKILLAQGHLATKPGFELRSAAFTLFPQQETYRAASESQTFFWMNKQLDITKISDSEAIQDGPGEMSRIQIHADGE